LVLASVGWDQDLHPATDDPVHLPLVPVAGVGHHHGGHLIDSVARTSTIYRSCGIRCASAASSDASGVVLGDEPPLRETPRSTAGAVSAVLAGKPIPEASLK
jgi:hypothetical protein